VLKQDQSAIRHIMATLSSVCVFCGSSLGNAPSYLRAAKDLGTLIASRGIRLIYGGASVGLMGAVADAAIAAGGEVEGVLPKALEEKELAHRGLSRLHVVSSMHERKAKMAELADGFIALPGGAGTLEEIFEIWTWAQLGFHRKPAGFLDVDGFYAALKTFIDHTVKEGFMRPGHRDILTFAQSGAELLDAFAAYEASSTPKWINKGQT
jgi:uncharacterized protein (TIGR00730 family)